MYWIPCVPWEAHRGIALEPELCFIYIICVVHTVDSSPAPKSTLVTASVSTKSDGGGTATPGEAYAQAERIRAVMDANDFIWPYFTINSHIVPARVPRAEKGIFPIPLLRVRGRTRVRHQRAAGV